MAAIIKWRGDFTEHFSLKEYTINQDKGTIYVTEEVVEHAKMLEEFRKWLQRPMKVLSWFRTSEYNKKCGGINTSSHLFGLATDWKTEIEIDDKKFVKYAKKWKSICEKHGCVGEAGLYSWGVHFGSHIKYSKSFYNWDSRSGKQKNMVFRI